MHWSFAILNNRLAEIYFEKDKKGNPKFLGHCYVNKSEYKTKKEQDMIEKDTSKQKFSYYKKKYRLKNNPLISSAS